MLPLFEVLVFGVGFNTLCTGLSNSSFFSRFGSTHILDGKLFDVVASAFGSDHVRLGVDIQDFFFTNNSLNENKVSGSQ